VFGVCSACDVFECFSGHKVRHLASNHWERRDVSIMHDIMTAKYKWMIVGTMAVSVAARMWASTQVEEVAAAIERNVISCRGGCMVL
jgi:hypothetical protein